MSHLVQSYPGNSTMLRLTRFIGEHARMRGFVRLSNLQWVLTYSAICVAIVVAFIVFFRHELGLDAIDYAVSPIGGFAIFGIFAVVALSVGLMGATFYSSRSGVDDEVGNARDIGESAPEGTRQP